MALDFPNNPSVDDTYTLGTRTWTWTGSAWRLASYTTGYTGSAGAGYTGSHGDTGYVGSRGSMGYTGSVGIGYTGSRGDTGFVGSQGELGYTGSQGVGYTGSRGDTGFVGSASTVIGYTGSAGAGYTGSQGDTGYTGSVGLQGDIGYTGSKGEDGVIGRDGYTGSQGNIGYTGSKGDTGMGFTIAKTYASVAALTADTSPTSIEPGQFAVIDTGDVENPENSRLYLWNGATYQYVSDLSGAQGIKGERGDIGYTGSTGYTGSIGYVGSKGTTHIGEFAPVSALHGDLWWSSTDGSLKVYYTDIDGSQWVDAMGAQGQQGLTGDIGYTGSAGPQGDQGYTGSRGVQGALGFTGSMGYTGSAGAGYTGSASTVPGYTGSIGYTGSAGAGYTGSASTVPGYTGSIGYTGSAGVTSTNPLAYTTLMMRLDGLQGSTVYSDLMCHPITATGTGIINTSAYSAGAYDNNNRNGYLSTPAIEDLVFGIDDFTVEFWVYPTTIGSVGAGDRSYYIQGPGWGIGEGSGYYFSGVTLTRQGDLSSYGSTISTSVSLSLNSWHHVALTRYQGVCKIWLDGVQTGGTPTISGDFEQGLTGNITIGGGTWGQLRDIRITKGISRYFDTFTPRTDLAPFNIAIPKSVIPYDFSGAAYGKPADGATILRSAVVRTISFPVALTVSAASCGLPPTSTVVCTVKKNGTAFGTVTFTAGSTIGTFAAASATQLTMGDVLTVTTPVTADATFGDVQITLAAALV